MTYDWGLLQPGQRLLRPELKFSRIFYYWAIMSNIILRCSWAVALSPNVGTSNDLLLFVLQIAEIFRRMQWFVIRVEWESYKTASTANPLQLKTRFTVSSPRSSQACFFLLLALLLFMQATNSFWRMTSKFLLRKRHQLGLRHHRLGMSCTKIMPSILTHETSLQYLLRYCTEQ